MTALIDTNVVLDAMISRAPFYEPAQKLFLLAAGDRITACVTTNCVTDIYYLLRKHLRDDAQCREALLKLFTLFTVLDVTGSDCRNALELPMPDYEDALLAACAKQCKVDCVVTRNIKDFVSSPVQALTPDDFLKSIQ